MDKLTTVYRLPRQAPSQAQLKRLVLPLEQRLRPQGGALQTLAKRQKMLHGMLEDHQMLSQEPLVLQQASQLQPLESQ